MVFVALSFSVISCENEAVDNQKSSDKKQSQEVTYLNPLELQFYIEPDMKAEEDGIPKTVIILATKGRGNIILVEEYNHSTIETEKYATYKVPQDAIFAFSSYFAGTGNNYYGKIEGKYLKVYKQIIEKENEADYDFELFKTYAFTESETIEL